MAIRTVRQDISELNQYLLSIFLTVNGIIVSRRLKTFLLTVYDTRDRRALEKYVINVDALPERAPPAAELERIFQAFLKRINVVGGIVRERAVPREHVSFCVAFEATSDVPCPAACIEAEPEHCPNKRNWKRVHLASGKAHHLSVRPFSCVR